MGTGTVLTKEDIVIALEQSGMEWVTTGPLLTVMGKFLAPMTFSEIHMEELKKNADAMMDHQ